jgi:cell division protein FtsW
MSRQRHVDTVAGRPRRRTPDFLLFLAVTSLVAIGIVMVYSSSSVKAEFAYGRASYFLQQQLIWALLGMGVMAAAMSVDYWRLAQLAWPALGLTYTALLAVLIPGVGVISHGASRRLGWGAIGFQPSEAAKLALVLFLAASLAANPAGIRRFWKGLVPYLTLLGLAFFLILKQPDLGTAVSLGVTAMVMIFVAGARLWHLVALGLGSVPVLFWAIFSVEYRRARFMAFFNPWADPLDSGFHIIQALYALGSGGLLGLGLGQSRQKFFYLPEQHTDFIFAVLGEEAGFLGGAATLLLFFLLFWRGYRIAITAPDTFSSLLAAGITTMIAVQALINIGVVTATLPITGIPLPFLSYGGSSLLFTLASVGVLLNISMYAKRA